MTKPIYITETVTRINNAATGRLAQQLRETRKFTRSEIARKMNVSAAMVQYLEQGKRGWTEELFAQWTAICNAESTA